MTEAGEPLRRAVTSFCEYADTKPKKTPTWFAFDESRPLAVFAGIWDHLARHTRDES
jgi:putative SOS response-associated peptidase YedK